MSNGRSLLVRQWNVPQPTHTPLLQLPISPSVTCTVSQLNPQLGDSVITSCTCHITLNHHPSNLTSPAYVPNSNHSIPTSIQSALRSSSIAHSQGVRSCTGRLHNENALSPRVTSS